MIDLSEYGKCALITKVTASTFNSQRLQISAVLLGLDLEFFSLGCNFSTFETEFHAVLRGEVVIPDLQPCIYLVQRPFLFREMLGFSQFLVRRVLPAEEHKSLNT
jgi:hypothetical protein